MIKEIKLLKILLIALIGTPISMFAQSGTECKVVYDYDVAGNRIKRHYDCTAVWTANDPTERTILTTVSPNPTTGVFTGIFSEPTDVGSFLISAADGRFIQSSELNQLSSSISFDITAEVPGSYFLTVWAFNKVETYTIIKL